MNSCLYILVLNGPNLNLLGLREPEIYGHRTLADINADLAEKSDVALTFEQYNSEGDIIDAIHRAGTDANCMGIALNAGAYTHYSYAIADAIAAVKAPVVEVHISNIAARDDFRHQSVIAPVCVGSIAGFGEDSYSLAINAIVKLYNKGKK